LLWHQGYAESHDRAKRTGAIGPTQIQSTWRALLQDVELMPQYQDFGFKPSSRFKAIAQHEDEKEDSCEHSAIMF
jgi:hypothetical protein